MSATAPRDGTAADALDPLATLLRRFTIEFLTCQDWGALPEVMAADYRLDVGGHVIAGRDEQYRPAMLGQFGQFPGLCVTVHDVFLGADAVAMRFTEHGASRRDGDRRAAWQGVSLFRVASGRLQRGWAEEDYLARKRQLRTGTCDPIEAPHPAPWDGRAAAEDPAAAAIARHWLLDGRAVLQAGPASAADPPPQALIAVTSTDIDEFVCAGARAAFHVTHHGTYAGGFADADPALVGCPVALRAAGLLTVEAGAVASAWVVADRLGLQRALRPR